MGSWVKEMIEGKKSLGIEKDITKEFMSVLASQSENKEFSIITWILGSTGSGKTSLMFILAQHILNTDKFEKFIDESGKEIIIPRHIQMYNVPDTLIKEVQRSMIENGFGEYATRITKIKALREIKNNAIVCIDEGILSANSKESLRIEFRNFEKGLSYSRHKRLFFIMNSTDDGILLAYRKKAHVIIYKMLSEGFIQYQNKDLFIKNHADIIRNLAVDESVLISDHKLFKKSGKIKLNSKQYVPYYNATISQNLSNNSFDADFERDEQISKDITKFARVVRDFFGKDLFKQKKINSIVEDWFELTYPEAFADLRRYIPKIVKRAMHFQYIIDRESKESAEEELEEQLEHEPDFNVTDDQLLQAMVDVNERDKKIYMDCLKQLTQDQIAKKNNLKSQGGISAIKKSIEGKLSQKKGKLYEKFYADKLKDKFNADPDVVIHYIEDNDREVDVLVLNGKNLKDQFKTDKELHDFYNESKSNKKIFDKFHITKIICISVKHSSLTRNEIEYIIDEFGPEIEYCKTTHEAMPNLQVECVFHYFSLVDKISMDRNIPFDNPPVKYLVKQNREIIACA